MMLFVNILQDLMVLCLKKTVIEKDELLSYLDLVDDDFKKAIVDAKNNIYMIFISVRCNKAGLQQRKTVLLWDSVSADFTESVSMFRGRLRIQALF